jgi:predicted Fe-Mo cluster-binding NifX family protein
MLAVAVRGEDVAPRFCSADEFVFVESDGGHVHCIRRLTFPEESWLRRLQRLSAAGVKVLLCGGFNGSLLPLAENLGIRVFCDLTGKAERLIDPFFRNELERHELIPYGRGPSGDAMPWAPLPER